MPLLLLCALAMSVGWGFRGDYGHEAGAMVPGALVALAGCLMVDRPDWHARASLLALLGALGWAFGGQMSYGRIVGYTMHTSFLDVAYGFACLFLLGALWGGIGAGILGLGVTRPRSELERFAWPLVVLFLVWQILDFSGATASLQRRWSFHGTDWVAASSALIVAAGCWLVLPRARSACLLMMLLAMGWWVGYGVLTGLLGLRMTPPRSDNWSGCLGLFLALAGYLGWTGNRAAHLLVHHGLLAGGIGFAVGDFVQVLGRGQWGPIGRFEVLQHLDYWKWMEQGFGLLMGLGIGIGFLRLLRGNLATVVNDEDGPLRWLAPLFLLVVMMWQNLFKNVRTWTRNQHLRDGLFGIEPAWWFLLVGVLLSLAVVLALIQHRRGRLALMPASALGRAQLLFLVILWVAVLAALLQAFPGLGRRGALFVHTSFWLTACVCTLMVLGRNDRPAQGRAVSVAADDPVWRPGWREGVLWASVVPGVLLLAWLAVESHAEPLHGSQLRFTVHEQESR